MRNFAFMLLLMQLINTGPSRKTGSAVAPPFSPIQHQVFLYPASSCPCALTTNPTSGDTIVIYYAAAVLGSDPTFTDNHGSSYSNHAVVTHGATTDGSGFAVATGIAGGAYNFSPSTAGGSAVFIAMEYPPITGIETSNPTAASISVTSLPVGPITTTALNSVILMGGYSDDTTVPSNANGWTLVASGTSGTTPSAAVWQFNATSTTNYSNTLTHVATTELQANLMGLKR